MARKAKKEKVKKKSDTNQQVIAQLYRLVYLPLLKSCPKSFYWKDWLEFLWGVNSRFISRFVIKSDFTLKGKEKETDKESKIFKFKRGGEVFVRVDADEPLVVHVELASSKSNKGTWFYVERSDWRACLKNLTHKPFRNTGREDITWDVTQFYS